MQNQPRPVIVRCFVFLLALSVVIGSSCTPRRQQQTTLRIWQTAVDPKAVAVLKEIGAELERKHPGVRTEIESVAWGALSSKLTAAVGAGNPPDIAHLAVRGERVHESDFNSKYIGQPYKSAADTPLYTALKAGSRTFLTVV